VTKKGAKLDLIPCEVTSGLKYAKIVHDDVDITIDIGLDIWFVVFL